MKYCLLLLLLAFNYANSFGQIIVKNKTSNNFTNLYIVEYDSILRTTGFCELIKNENLIKRKLLSKEQATIDFKLDLKKYYNLIFIDTTDYPHLYNLTAFKYHISGKSKLISLDSINIESDFRDHCSEEPADHKLEDFNIKIDNKSSGNIIKIYFRYNQNDAFVRYRYFHQWSPLKKDTKRDFKLYNSKPLTADKIYVRATTEKKGVISERYFEGGIKKNQNTFEITVQ